MRGSASKAEAEAAVEVTRPAAVEAEEETEQKEESHPAEIRGLLRRHKRSHMR